MAKNYRLTGIPAWALSLIALFVLFIPLFLLDNSKNEAFQIGGYILCIFISSLASFVICRAHPKSVLYTPIIINALGVIAIIVYFFTDLSEISEVLFWGISMTLSFTGAVMGARIGRKRIN
ncbi:MAG: hypothetical protein C0598_12445 [Marinilabiliales bacterium]|nr:MAG: hypothetical protein C0598_12445 [Marinilabiliales bacterium]